MSNKDFQNGFALGYASGGVMSEKILDYTVTFTVDGEPYEIVSVKDGNSVNAPTKPEKEGYKFTGWFDENNVAIMLPFVPTTDITISTILEEGEDYTELINALYTKAETTPEAHPYITIAYYQGDSTVTVYLTTSKSAVSNNGVVYTYGSAKYRSNIGVANSDFRLKNLLEIASSGAGTYSSTSSGTGFGSSCTGVYANHTISGNLSDLSIFGTTFTEF